jgi:hypothetical protein
MGSLDHSLVPSGETTGSIGSLGLFLVTVIVIIFPTVGYVDTIRIMVNSRSNAAYNLKTIMIIMTAQGIKVFYFFFHRYSLTILGQAIALIIVAAVLTYVKFLYADQNEFRRLTPHPVFLDCSHICRLWNVSQASSFSEFLTVLMRYGLVFFVFFLCFCIVIGRSATVECMGLIATLCESATSLPIVFQVVFSHSIRDISPILIFQYICGDLFKVGLIVVTAGPLVFLFGALCQVIADLACMIVFIQLKLAQQDDFTCLEQDNIELDEKVCSDDHSSEYCKDVSISDHFLTD